MSEPGKPVCEMEFMQSLTTPSQPPPAYKQIKIRKGVLWHLLASFKRLLSFCLLVFGLSRLGQGAEGLNVFYTAISEPIALEFGSHATVRLIGIPWRARRRIKRWSKRAAKNVTKKIADILPSPDILPTPPPVPSISQHANIFLRWMNPAVEARQWLIAENLDEPVVNRMAPEVEPIKEERVSVDVKKCKSELNRGTSTFGLIQAVESAFNTLGQLATTPLIVDSGASCCISPHREDFITYTDSKVKIRDLSGSNKVGIVKV